MVQIWPGQTLTCLHTNSPGHIWTTLYIRLLRLALTPCCPDCHYSCYPLIPAGHTQLAVPSCDQWQSIQLVFRLFPSAVSSSSETRIRFSCNHITWRWFCGCNLAKHPAITPSLCIHRTNFRGHFTWRWICHYIVECNCFIYSTLFTSTMHNSVYCNVVC